jgi:hypothetical protein
MATKGKVFQIAKIAGRITYWNCDVCQIVSVHGALLRLVATKEHVNPALRVKEFLFE